MNVEKREREKMNLVNQYLRPDPKKRMTQQINEEKIGEKKRGLISYFLIKRKKRIKPE